MSSGTSASVVLDGKTVPLADWLAHCRSQPPRQISQTAAPVVSIIIPACNQWTLTSSCISSILEADDASVPFEIILVDDCSSDDTLKATEFFQGLRVVRQTKNQGYIAASHAGAAKTRGKYILFLNNDTIVCPGYLAALTAMLEKRSDVAIAGSRLIFDDGRIQDGGGILWSDGSADRYGQDAAFGVEYLQYPREVDYICGASLMVRKDFWNKTGGYDTRFGKGYYEDSDLAMQARAMGMCAMFVPASLVIHCEHASMGDNANITILHNKKLFYDKWHNELNAFHLLSPPVNCYHQGMANACRRPTPEGIKRRAQQHFNILYYSPWPTHPVAHGNQSSMVNFGSYFREQGHTVHFTVLGNTLSDEQASLMREFWNSVDFLKNTNIFPEAKDPVEGIPWDGWYDEALGHQVLALCLKYDIDMIFCSYIFQCKMLEYVPKHILKVIDTHDRMGNRFAMLKEHGVPLHFFSTFPETEGGLLRRADIVVARSDEEQFYFNKYTEMDTAITIPHSDVPHFTEQSFDKLKNVGIIASENYINCKMLLDFTTALKEELGGTHCSFLVNIAGNVAQYYERLQPEQRELFDLPYVNLLGYVSDVGKFYRSQDIIAVPVTVGTGINTKTVQAFSFGMPVISTRCGSKGTASSEVRHLYPDDNLRALVKGLLELHDQPDELNRLAQVSKDVFTNYRKKLLTGMHKMFAHPKLQNR